MSRAIPSNIVTLAAPQQGLDGRTTLAAARPPAITDGRIGDFFIDTDAKKLYGPKVAAATLAAIWPDNGLIKGDTGWAPLLAAVADGSRRVQQVVDWTGGEGAKPATGQYLGATGLVADIADAVDVRGPEGPQALIDALTVAAADITDDSLISTAEVGDDNEKRAAVEVFDLGGELVRRTVSHAAASTVRKGISRVRIGSETYRRAANEPSGNDKFRSQDRWTDAGNFDSANGGWWVRDEGAAVRFDREQSLTAVGKQLARFNIGLPLSVTLQDYGGICDGIADDSAALGLAVDTIVARGGGELRLSGFSRIASAVQRHFESICHMDLRASGYGSGGLIVDNTVGGLILSSTSRESSLHASDLFIEPLRDGAGKGLSFSLPEGGNQARHRFSCENVTLTPRTYGSAFAFNEPLAAKGLYRPYIRKVMASPGTTATTKQTAILNLDGSYKPHVEGSYFNGAAIHGIKHESGAPEGMFCLANTINGADYGLWFVNAGNEPELWVDNCHMNCLIAGGYIDGAKYFWLTKNLMYVNPTEEENYADWKIVSANGGLIADNIYRQPFAERRRHIDMTPRTGGVVRDIDIREGSSAFQAASTVPPIRIGAGVVNVTAQLPSRAAASGFDFALYPAELMEVAPSAVNIRVQTTEETRLFRHDAAEGPFQDIFRDSASPAAGDALGSQKFYGRNTSGAKVPYGTVRAALIDPAAGSEDGVLQLYATTAGAALMAATIGNGGLAAGNLTPEPNAFLSTGGFYVRSFGVNRKVVGVQQSAIADASSGQEVTKINAILVALRAHGLIAT